MKSAIQKQLDHFKSIPGDFYSYRKPVNTKKTPRFKIGDLLIDKDNSDAGWGVGIILDVELKKENIQILTGEKNSFVNEWAYKVSFSKRKKKSTLDPVWIYEKNLVRSLDSKDFILQKGTKV